MRIGLVTGEYPPMEGGVGAFTDQLARALSVNGHEVHVITSRRARPSIESRKPSALFQPVDLGYAQLHARANRWRWPTLSLVADLAIRYDLEIINLQYQAAAFNMRSAAIYYLPWRLKSIVPTVVTFHDLKVPYLFPKANGLRGRVVRDLARRAHGCIATNEADLRCLRLWTPRPVVKIPIGSNIDAYEPNHVEVEEARAGLGLTPNDFLLGYFGFLNETKGADTLIDALARLDDRHHLVFIGGQTGASDPDNNRAFLEQLRSRIDEAGLSQRVHWTGFLSPQRVSTQLVAADLMVMPYRDGVSLRRGTLMAVLAHGRPLLTTLPVDESPEFRHGENMWLIPPDDPVALAKAIAMLSADFPIRTQMAAEAELLARSYSWDSIAAHTTNFYTTLLAERSDWLPN